MELTKKALLKIPKIEFPKIDLSKYLPKKTAMPELKIGDLVIKTPIIQGGMGVRVSLSNLASAVANEGGIGVIAANAIGMDETDYYENGKEANIRALRKEIRKARSLTSGVIGVNIMVALNDFSELLEVAIEESADIVFLGAGLPLKDIPIDKIKVSKIKIVPIVSSGRAASLIFRFWDKNFDRIPDAVVVEGPKAGGHLGFSEVQISDPAYQLEKIVPEVIQAVSVYESKRQTTIPVIAAGGVFTGDDIFKFIKLGASGVQMGTRFVATDECEANEKFKKTYLDCQKEDVRIIKSPVGLPGRAIMNDFIRRAHSGIRQKFRCSWRCLEHCKAGKANYCISEALNFARMGELDKGYAFAGSNVHRVREIVPVKSLFSELKLAYSSYLTQKSESIKLELERTVERLSTLKEEYVLAAEKGLKAFKLEMEGIVEKKRASVKEEYQRFLMKIEDLKSEYSDHLDKFDELKLQLSDFLDTSNLRLPKLPAFNWTVFKKYAETSK